MDRPDRRADALYRVLLRAYPRAFREDVGAEMRQTFAERHRVEHARGRRATARLWARTLWDTARNAVPERVDALRAAGRDALDALAEPRPAGRRGGPMDAVRQDLQQAMRSLRSRPAFTAVAVLTLALGIGANAAIFSVVHAMLFRSLPYPDADRIVTVWAQTKSGRLAASYPEFVEWRGQTRSFDALGVFRGQSVSVTGGAEPERLVGAFVSASFFDVLGVRPHVGRLFQPAETEPESVRPVAVLSHAVWTRRFGAEPGLVGRDIVLNGRTHTVVGVLSPDFGPGRAPYNGWFMGTEAFLPAPYFPNARGLDRGQSEFLAVGRVRQGVHLEEVQADVGLVASRLEKSWPETHAGRAVQVTSLKEELVGDTRPMLLLLFGAVWLVLLIACANVANLLLARAAQRQREMAVRAALGAGRARLVRQLLTESVVLAAAGGLAGIAVGYAGLKGLLTALPPDMGLPEGVGLDGPVLAFTLVSALATAIVFGLAPALQASRPELDGVLKESGRGGGAGRARRRLRDALVVSEVALSLVLLVGAGLLLRTVHALGRADTGFRTDRLLTMEFRLPTTRYAQPDPIRTFFRGILDRIAAVPGIESVALVRAVPLSQNSPGGGEYLVEGQPETPVGQGPQTQLNIVSDAYFRTMGIPVLAGRTFDDERDTAQAPRAAVVGTTFARNAFPGQDPIGKRFRIRDQGDWLTVIGVVGDIRHRLRSPLAPQVYASHEQDPRIFACVVARTAGEPLALSQAVRQAIWSVDADQPVWNVRSMEGLLDGARGPSRALGKLIGAFAVVAVFLAAVGLYGVLSQLVAQRTREIGIRMALGASAGRVLALVVGRGMGLTALAVVVGLAGAAALSRLMSSLLFGVRPLDPLTFVGAALALAGAALVACWVPARRAARVDPALALAEE